MSSNDAEAEPGHAADLARFGTATVLAAHPAARALPPRIVRIAGTRCAGPVRTALMRDGDNRALHEAIAAAEPGDVIVGTVDGDAAAGYLGEIMARACRVRQVAGVVLDATVRDVDDLREIGLPIFATGRGLPDTTKHADSTHRAGARLCIGGATIVPGDWLVADGSGIVHFPREVLRHVVRASSRRYESEEAMRRLVQAGTSTLDLVTRGS